MRTINHLYNACHIKCYYDDWLKIVFVEFGPDGGHASASPSMLAAHQSMCQECRYVLGACLNAGLTNSRCILLHPSPGPSLSWKFQFGLSRELHVNRRYLGKNGVRSCLRNAIVIQLIHCSGPVENSLADCFASSDVVSINTPF